jgi:NhaP-type Na+/H+ and K+/H+ antiporter
MKNEKINEDVSDQEFIRILKTGNIKIKRFVVEGNSMLEDLQRKMLILPRNVMMGPVVRKDKIILPDGDTKLISGDIIIFFGNENDLILTHKLLSSGGVSNRFKSIISNFFSRLTHKNGLSGGY